MRYAAPSVLSAAVMLGITAGGAHAQTTLIDRLMVNAAYTLESYGAGFSQSYQNSRREIDDGAVETWNRFTVESKAPLDPDLSFEIKAFGVLSTQDAERRGVFSEPGYRSVRPRLVDVSEISLRRSFDDFQLSAGRMLHPVGVGNLFSPANRFNNVDASHPMHPIEMGVWSARTDVFVGDDTLAIAIVPWTDRAGDPSRTSRWLGESGNYDFGSIDRAALGIADGDQLDVQEEYLEATPRNYGYLVHYKGFRRGYDFFGLLHNGPSVYPVLKRETTTSARYIKEYPLAFTVAGGISATDAAWTYYSELATQSTYDDRDQDFSKYVLGVSYREVDIAELFDLEEITPILEYAGEIITHQQDKSRYAEDSHSARPGRNSISFRLLLRQTDKLNYSISGSSNLHTRDYLLATGVEYKFSDSLKLRGDIRMFDGNSDTHYGRWSRNDHMEIGIISRF